MKLILKAILLSLFVLVLSGCGPKFYHFDKNNSDYNNESALFNIKRIDVALHNYDTANTEKKVSYYSTDIELANILKKDIVEKLQNQKKLCNDLNTCYDVKVDLNYNRLFALLSNETIQPRFSYFVKVTKNHKTVFQYHKIDQIIDEGIIGDFSTVAKTGSKKSNTEEEISHIKLISTEIVELLLKAKQ